MNKKIKTFGLISLLLSNIMGTSTFLSSRSILKNVKSCKISLLMWLVSAIISIFFGLCYSELGSTYPEAGGDVVYLSKAFSSYVGTSYSLCSLFMVLPSCTALFCEMIHTEVCKTPNYKMLTAFVILAFCIFIVLLGNDVLVLVCKMSFMIKIVTVFFFLFTSAYTIIFKKVEHVAAFYDEKGAIKNTSSYMGIISAMLYGMWGFDGWNCGNYMADEIYRPEYTFKIGITLAIILAYSFNTIINIAFLMVVPYDTYIDESKSLFVGYLSLLGIKLNGTIISTLTVIIPLFGTLLGIIIVYRGIASSLIRNRIKHGDIYGMGVLIALTLFYSNAKHATVVLKFMQICTILFYTLCCYGLLVLRYKKPDIERPFKCHISIPIISSIAGSLLLIAFCIVKID